MSTKVNLENGVEGVLPVALGGTGSSTGSAAGATGGGTDKVFWKNDKVITTDYTISSTENAGTFGPVTIADGVTVTISDGATWTVV